MQADAVDSPVRPSLPSPGEEQIERVARTLSGASGQADTKVDACKADRQLLVCRGIPVNAFASVEQPLRISREFLPREVVAGSFQWRSTSSSQSPLTSCTARFGDGPHTHAWSMPNHTIEWPRPGRARMARLTACRNSSDGCPLVHSSARRSRSAITAQSWPCRSPTDASSARRQRVSSSRDSGWLLCCAAANTSSAAATKASGPSKAVSSTRATRSTVER